GRAVEAEHDETRLPRGFAARGRGEDGDEEGGCRGDTDGGAHASTLTALRHGSSASAGLCSLHHLRTRFSSLIPNLSPVIWLIVNAVYWPEPLRSIGMRYGIV